MKNITRIAALFAALCFSSAMEAEDKMDSLTQKEQNIALAAAYAARGDQNGLRGALASGLDSGVSVNEYKEVLVQVYAYCGFPRSLNSLATFMELLKSRGGKDAFGAIPDSFPKGDIAFGTENQTKLAGREVKGPIFEFAPAIDEFLKTHLFGDIFGRNNLDWKTREIATIAMLAAMEGTESQLASHINIGKHNGITDGQVGEILRLVENGPKGMSNTSPFPLGEENTAYAKYFSGKSYLAPLASNSELGVPVANVTFEPACRNNWHSHTGGQILIAVGGIGFYQEKGKPARRLKAGDVSKLRRMSCTGMVRLLTAGFRTLQYHAIPRRTKTLGLTPYRTRSMPRQCLKNSLLLFKFKIEGEVCVLQLRLQYKTRRRKIF